MGWTRLDWKLRELEVGIDFRGTWGIAQNWWRSRINSILEVLKRRSKSSRVWAGSLEFPIRRGSFTTLSRHCSNGVGPFKLNCKGRGYPTTRLVFCRSCERNWGIRRNCLAAQRNFIAGNDSPRGGHQKGRRSRNCGNEDFCTIDVGKISFGSYRSLQRLHEGLRNMIKFIIPLSVSELLNVVLLKIRRFLI